MTTISRSIKPLTRIIYTTSRSVKFDGISLIAKCEEKFESVLLCIACQDLLKDLIDVPSQPLWTRFTVSQSEKEKYFSLNVSNIHLLWHKLAKVMPVWILDSQSALSAFDYHFNNYQQLFAMEFEFRLSSMLPLVTSLYEILAANGFVLHKNVLVERDDEPQFNIAQIKESTSILELNDDATKESSEEDLRISKDDLINVKKAVIMLNKITDKVTSGASLEFLIQENSSLKREIVDLKERVAILEGNRNIIKQPLNMSMSLTSEEEYQPPLQSSSRKRMMDFNDEEEYVPYKVIKLVGDTRAVFISRLRRDFTELEIESKLIRLNIYPVKCQKLYLKENSCSHFYVEVRKEDLEFVLEPYIWPEGCLVEEYRWVVLP